MIKMLFSNIPSMYNFKDMLNAKMVPIYKIHAIYLYI